MQKLYLVRHGESEWNKFKKIQGQKDVRLTDKGRKQADKIANRLLHEDIDLIYSSDLSRAYETATIIGNKLNKDVFSLKDFREIKFGPWEGINIDEIDKNSKEEHLIWLKEPHKFKMEGAETLIELQNRAMRSINDILKSNPGKNILIVSHSATLKTIILSLLDMDIKYYSKMSLSNVSLSIVEFRDYNNVLRLLNDTCHLREGNNEG